MYLNWTQWAMGGFKVEVSQLDLMGRFKVELFVFSIGLTHVSAEKQASPAPTPRPPLCRCPKGRKPRGVRDRHLGQGQGLCLREGVGA